MATATRPSDRIIGRGLLAAEAVASELRERIIDRLSRANGGDGPYIDETRMIEIAREELEAFEPILARTLYDTEIAAWIAGASGVADMLPDGAWIDQASVESFFVGQQPPDQPPASAMPAPPGDDGDPIVTFPAIERAAESLAERKVLLPEDFRALADGTQRSAFTVARQGSIETLAKIRDTLAISVREGIALDDFRDLLTEAIDTSQIGPGHLENVYRTNVQTAYMDGFDELASDPIAAAAFPYQEYIAVHDDRARHDHLALETLGMNGTNVYRRDDPMWDYFLPPWDYQCRCGVNLLTIQAAARKGVREAQEWLKTGEPPTVPEWRINAIPFRPKPGWGGRARQAA